MLRRGVWVLMEPLMVPSGLRGEEPGTTARGGGKMLVKAPCGPGRAFSNQVPRYPTIPPSSREISYRDLVFSLPSSVSRSLSREPPPAPLPPVPSLGSSRASSEPRRSSCSILPHPAAPSRET